MLNLLCRFLGIERPSRINPYDQLEIRFHKEANRFGEHGTLVATHIRQGIDKQPIRFVFVGMARPPKLTLELHTYIWEEAKAQGYIPHDLQTYGKENEMVDTSKPVITAKVEPLVAV